MTGRHAKHGLWAGTFLGVLALLCPGAARGAPRDAGYAEERRSLEAARYLFEIEGDNEAAIRILDRLKDSPNEEIRTQGLYLRGFFLEEQGKTAEAVRLYTGALGSDGLSPPQRQRLIARLLVLNPEAIKPFREAGKARGLPARVFESPTPQGNVYVMVESGEADRPARLTWQDPQGMLRVLKAPLAGDEEVLDATPERLLTRSLSRQKTYLRRAPGFVPTATPEKFTAQEGFLFSGESGDYLLIGDRGLRLMRGGQTLFSHPLPGSGCTYHPSAARSRQGVLFCPGQSLYRADFARRTLTPIPFTGEAPSAVALSGEYLAVRYLNHVEIRRGPAFGSPLWSLPAGLQDPLALGRGHVFIAATGGPLRAISLRTGRVDWQRNDGASTLRADGGELFVLTHARTCLALDEKGRLLYSYEMGWSEEEPLLLPARDWLVVQQADGDRTRLNRELLGLTGGHRDYLFHEIGASLRRGDARGALRELNALIALEPGNGLAWREKARLLAEASAPRREQALAWTQAARSAGAAPWSADPALRSLSTVLGASWVWKRQPGPRFFPVLTGGRQLAFYVENDNQTLVVLDTRSGTLKGTYRFAEPLDLKVAVWSGDTLIVSSATRLYLMAPLRGTGILAQIPLRNPVGQALVLPEGLLFSDWNGNLQLLDLGTRRVRWNAKLGRGGLLIAREKNSPEIDVAEIEGAYHRVRVSDGGVLGTLRLPPGTITELHAGDELAYVGYNEGLIAGIERARTAIAWQRDMGEQIFSLSGRGDQVLIVGTASKRLLNLRGKTGAQQSQTQVSTYLFNRPVLTDEGYWVGTTEPALEKRSFGHVLLLKLPLTDMPGTPSLVGSGIAVSTLDNFILQFPAR
jgi:outer membrane protein assembly factor BamB